MDIKKYTGYFHDGSILAIQHQKNNLVIFMQSAEMDEEDKLDDVIFSKKGSIRGKLHLEEVTSITEEDAGNLIKFEMKTEDAEIFDFKLNENQVEFQIIWDSIPVGKEDFSVVKIEAEKIWWENCPDMPDP